ncbi:MAG: alpha/beta hydrolase [Lysobacteraceae bacterium]|nr:MAG: alpha/beta hydrolase [Xanthomonadaceae bacterium]
MKPAQSDEPQATNGLAPGNVANDLRGVARLLVDGVTATTDLVESVHASILGLPARLLGRGTKETTGGIPRIAYQGVRATAGLVGSGIEEVASWLAPQTGRAPTSAQREALIAALNGVLGDHLAASANPLALKARLLVDGHPLPTDGPAWPARVQARTPRLLVLVHGLCMNHLQWRHRGHDHGEQLAAALGYTTIHLHYNSGLSIAGNGREFSALLQRLLEDWPVPIERFAILGHSMGGLVTRAAIAAAIKQRESWVTQLDQVVFLGTPHHGAPLERAGNMLQTVLGMTPWTAPFVRLGQVRSAGIQDLRHGAIDGASPGAGPGPRLPRGIRAYAVAGVTRGLIGGRGLPLFRGDGLVPVDSALGDHPDPRLALRIPRGRRLLVEDTGHLDLLGSPEVYDRLRHWLA